MSCGPLRHGNFGPVADPLVDHFRALAARWILSPLQGVVFADWLRALRANRFAVAPKYWPRALVTTASSLLNSVQARREERLYGDRIRATEVVAPIFVLGHYRNGTTHLHNLLAADERFGYPNNFQATQPHTFLSTESIGSRLGSALTMRKRPHDDVAFDLRVPTEDELAICADTLLSPHMAWHFPLRAEYYNRRFLTFREASEHERARWIASIRRIAQKLTFKHAGRRLVLKSPLHTARVPLLLEAFPDAVFVHVHRNPYKVFVSTRNMELKVEPLFRYQRAVPGTLEDRILWRYRALYDAFLEDRHLVSEGKLIEISYRQLVDQPLATLQSVYAALGLPDFEPARPALEAYLQSLRGYKRNVYPELPRSLRARIGRHWHRCFDAWGYPL